MKAKRPNLGQIQLLSVINGLNHWIEENGWAGYDPYDIKGAPLFLFLQKPNNGQLLKIVSRFIFGFENRFPLLCRGLCGVKKQINPKAMGLFSSAYLNLYKATSDVKYKYKALECLDWLIANPSIDNNGLSWGYPFDWQSKVFIPKGTPSAVVSSVVGDGFWTAYQVLGGSHYLDICDKICSFFINSLNIDRISSETICFSYTPLDNFHVHNANLFVAEFLIRIGKEIGNEKYVMLGSQASDYSLSEQNTDGSIYYWGNIQNHYSPKHIDHYHSGFEIRAIYSIWKCTGDEKYKTAVERYFKFYRNELLIIQDGLIAPKMNPLDFYPVDIHSCAEAILCNSLLAEEFPEALDALPDLLCWVGSKMQTEAGWFIYMLKNANRPILIPYMRWGQAWMLLALSRIANIYGLQLDSVN